jgi:hypothetical protein
MINARTVIVSVFGAVLVVVPLVRSQDVRPYEAKMIVIQPLPIQALGFLPRGAPAGLLQVVPVLAPAMGGRDLSRYRGFQFGETLPAVAKQAGLDVSQAKVIHERPALLQELEWPIWLASNFSAPQDPVRTILFSFYNGELFRILVSYDPSATKGLTTEDLTEAISAQYGTATKPANVAIAFSSTQVDNDSEAVIARWENSQYSFDLYRSSYQPTFGMIAFSKRLDALARSATAEAIRLDAVEAPQREIQRQNQEDEKNRESLEKARQVNKSKFRL